MKIALLLKLALLALLVVVAFDGGNLARTAYRADNVAGDAARAATASYDDHKDVQQAYNAAVAAVGSDDVIDPETFLFDKNGGVTLTLHRQADSVVLGKIQESWTEVTVKGSALTPSS